MAMSDREASAFDNDEYELVLGAPHGLLKAGNGCIWLEHMCS